MTFVHLLFYPPMHPTRITVSVDTDLTPIQQYLAISSTYTNSLKVSYVSYSHMPTFQYETVPWTYHRSIPAEHDSQGPANVSMWVFSILNH